MRKLTVIEAIQELSKALNKPCMYLQFNTTDIFETDPQINILAEIIKAAPYLDLNDGQMIVDEIGIIVFDNEEEMEKIYNQTKGDDINHINNYKGLANIYAITCNSNGILLNENT